MLDESIFRFLNGTLAYGAAWQGFWAIANWRPFDLVAGFGARGNLLHGFFAQEPLPDGGPVFFIREAVTRGLKDDSAGKKHEDENHDAECDSGQNQEFFLLRENHQGTLQQSPTVLHPSDHSILQ